MLTSRARFGSKIRTVALTCLVLLLLISWAPPAGSGGRSWFHPSERCVMNKINDSRARNGMRRLKWDRQLGFVARQHAQVIAKAKGLWHDPDLGQTVTRWRRLAQNTGRGGPCRRIMRSFMNSSPHRANILGRWRFMGVGTQWRGGRLYVQQVFETRRNPGNIFHRP
jgi:uncharacterized protein YkwD